MRGTLVAALMGLQLPLKATLKVKFDANSREYRFDFAFAEYSTDSAVKR
jgi:hypothetical protein